MNNPDVETFLKIIIFKILFLPLFKGEQVSLLITRSTTQPVKNNCKMPSVVLGGMLPCLTK